MFDFLSKNTSDDKYRHEYKYVIDRIQYEELKIRLPGVLDVDKHTINGIYNIRSLYFDDYADSYYYDNLNGNEPREKFRIRIYNGSLDVIKLELKIKRHGKTLKKSCGISPELAKTLSQGKPIAYSDDLDPLLKKFYILQETRFLQPKVIVEYDRIPYICQDGNVRVTLDLDIRSSSDLEKFLEKEIHARPVMPNGQNILEVKFDEFLPDYIHNSLQLKKLQQTTFSKYFLCRNFPYR
ncbi:MAG: polyphosphate polymerase domain-containing protein [Clostridia bacterium]|nr:polyphosphate polymerase domain-containing protein [Clostridia bacterium]